MADDTTTVYSCEDVLSSWISRGTINAYGSRWAVEPERHFEAVPQIQGYVDEVLDTIGCTRPVKVRRSSGTRRASYRASTISIPSERMAGSAWALRESVVLHEIAHHLADDGHGPDFRAALIDLLTQVGRPVHAQLLAIVFAEEGLR